MNRRIFSVFCFLLFAFGLSAQNTWLQTYDPFDEAIFSVEDVLVCSDGGYALNGTCIDLNTTINWGFVIRTDSEGNMLWANKDIVDFQSENESRAFVETEDGGFLSSSYFWVNGTALIKRDINGSIVDSILLEDIAINSMCNTNDSNIVLAGHNYVNYQTDDDWPCLIKINQDSEIIWEQVYEFENYEWGNIHAVIQSNDEGFLLTGYKDANGGPFDMDVIVIKTDSDGDTLWTRTYDGFQDWDHGNSIIETTNGEILLVGESYESNFRSIHGLIWNLSSQGETNWLELTYSDFGWAHWSVAEYQENEYIAFCGFNYDGKFYGFDGDYSILWEMENICGASGDRNFCVDGEYIIWPETGSSFILHKAIPDQNSVNENIINKDKFLLSNYPNPFNPSTTISYTLSESGFIDLSIYNTKGQKIKSLVNDFKTQGVWSIEWDGLDLNNKRVSSGIYFVKMKIDSRLLKTHKILLIK